MKYCCENFAIAIQNEFIKKPGDRLPYTGEFSKKYFIGHYDMLEELNYFMYIDYCPSCGEKI